ncbi:hypothetical protein KFL_000060720 [Klebsormidium nitens]|uniref:Rhodanese domain-containing protein n=1 Tax=Klebsormidium nitens TaxID=105231 RepID=A0A0U9HHZ0_KLENI|nr:hypothetical protein KFL_000060720 [Klebsormidium nitens]|eukprot:GAQ78005.1 hypothetical protein KFL_000060720 [Klebsormidium nitens]
MRKRRSAPQLPVPSLSSLKTNVGSLACYNVGAKGLSRPQLWLELDSRRISHIRALADENVPEADGEKMWSIEEILAEAEAEGANFVFSEADDSEDEEEFMKTPAIRASSDGPGVDLPTSDDMTRILSAYGGAETESIHDITVEELQLELQSASPRMLLDVRSEQEYSSGHVPGAVHLPLESLVGRVSAGEVDIEGKPLAVICASGSRSARAALELKTFCQAKDVVNVRGGTLAWIDAGYPIDKR